MPGKIVTQAEWLLARRDLLTREKELQKSHDALTSTLRSFPVTKVEKDYTFTSSSGPITLSSLFHNRKQLIIYHFMLSPTQDAGCHGCSFVVDNLPSTLTHLNSRNTTFVLVSRAPIEKIEEFKKRMGWEYEWVSSYGTDFNRDYGVLVEEGGEFNYRKVGGEKSIEGDMPGLSCFFKEGGEVFHTYSTYARGLEGLLSTYRLLDMTVLGRQDEQMGDWKLSDEYADEDLKGNDK